MKTIARNSIVLLLAACTAISCGTKAETTVKLDGISIEPKSVSLQKGETQQLTAVFSPENVTTKPEVVWSSSKPAVASVSETGLVTALAKGETYIILTTADGAYKANCFVKVSTPSYQISISYAGSDELVPDTVYGYPGQEFSVTASHNDSEEHSFTWGSSNPDAVAVDGGKVSLKPVPAETGAGNFQFSGRAVISATTETGNSAGFEAVSTLGFTLADAYFELGSEQQLNFGSEYAIKAFYDNAGTTAALPEGTVSLSTSNPELAAISASAEGWVLVAQHSEETVDVLLTVAGQSFKLFTIGKALPASGDLEGYEEKNG